MGTAPDQELVLATIAVVKIHKNSPTGNHILYLLDTEHHRYLRIWIGDHEGEQIRLQLEGTPTTLPMTYHLPLHIGTEYLLLGILREGGGMAVTLLQDLNVDLAGLERGILAALAGATE